MSPASFLRPLHRLFDGDPARQPRLRRWLVLTGRTLALALRDWIGDQCALRAAALTYVTAMSLIPLLALASALAKGFGFAERLWGPLRSWAENKPTEIQEAIEAIILRVDTTQWDKIGGIAFLLLLWTAITLFSRVERAFHAIWKTRSRRGHFARYGTYLSFLLISPLVVLLAFTSNAVRSAGAVFDGVRESHPALAPAFGAAAVAASATLQSLVFALLYRVLPGARVRLGWALAGGLTAGILWQAVQTLYLGAQYFVTKKGTIYGSFAALPLLLVFIYGSWSVFLFGGEVSHAAARAARLRRWTGLRRLRPASRTALLAVMSSVAESYRMGKGPWRPPGSIPLERDSIDAAADHLVAAGILLRTENPPGSLAPARPPDQITALEVARAGERPEPEDGILSAPLAEACARADEAADRILADQVFDGAEPGPESEASSDHPGRVELES